MILKIENEKFITVEIFEEPFPEIEMDFVSMDEGQYIYEPDEIIPYSISGVFVKDENGNYVSDEESDLNEMKLQRMNEIQAKFEDMMYYGTFESSLGFVADNRRGGGKDDKDNVSSLIDLGQEPVYFRDHDNNFQELTIDDLKILKQEMIQDGLMKYQWKWNKESEVMSATNLEELASIVI